MQSEHAAIGVDGPTDADFVHTKHPGVQWFPEASLGLFIHWGLSSVRAINISWPMFDRGEGAKIWEGGTLTVELPAARRTPLVDVVRVVLPPSR